MIQLLRLLCGALIGLFQSSARREAEILVLRQHINMAKHRRPPSQGWRTFLTNHADGIAAIDLFVLPTITFRLLYCLVILRHGRRLWVSFGVTTNPTAEWISRQITEAFPWDSAAKYLVRDKDRAFGAAFKARVRAMGIRDRPTSFRSAETAQEIWNGILHWHDAGGEPLRAAT